MRPCAAPARPRLARVPPRGPRTVAGLVPFLITCWRWRPALLGLEAGWYLGAALVVGGLASVVHSFARFALEGRVDAGAHRADGIAGRLGPVPLGAQPDVRRGRVDDRRTGPAVRRPWPRVVRPRGGGGVPRVRARIRRADAGAPVWRVLRAVPQERQPLAAASAGLTRPTRPAARWRDRSAIARRAGIHAAARAASASATGHGREQRRGRRRPRRAARTTAGVPSRTRAPRPRPGPSAAQSGRLAEREAQHVAPRRAQGHAHADLGRCAG